MECGKIVRFHDMNAPTGSEKQHHNDSSVLRSAPTYTI